MSECRWAGTDQPRMMNGRHDYECSNDQCPGCQPCGRAHCRVCQHTHAAGACPECLAATRVTLHDIARRCDALPAEVESRGVHGEAMMLNGPAADPEARGHLEASVLAGRVPADYLEHADHDRHPLFVLGSWEMVWRDALEHDDQATLTIAAAVDYLDRQLATMSASEHVPFEDFACDLRQCDVHLEAVLHDQALGECANVGCFKCGGDLERKLTTAGFEDSWTCRRCRQRYTIAEYNFALRAKLEADVATDCA